MIEIRHDLKDPKLSEFMVHSYMQDFYHEQ